MLKFILPIAIFPFFMSTPATATDCSKGCDEFDVAGITKAVQDKLWANCTREFWNKTIGEENTRHLISWCNTHDVIDDGRGDGVESSEDDDMDDSGDSNGGGYK